MRFNFIGEFGCKDDYLRVGTTKNGANYKSLNASVASQKNNRAFIELFGTEQSKIYSMDTNNQKIEIAWADRNDEDVMKSIAGYKKNVIAIGDSRKEFVSSLDAINYISENIDVLKGSKVCITGQVNKNVYNGKISDRFVIQNIYTTDDETKNQLKVVMEYFFNVDCFDFNDWDSKKRIVINGYTSNYMSDEKKNMFVPQEVIFDCSKIDWSNEKHVELVKYKLGLIGCDLVDNKPVCKLNKNKGFFSMMINCSYVNGAEEVEFNESMLTPTQKEAIEFGINTLDDFKPNGSAYGDRITTYKLTGFELKGNYEDGMRDAKISESDFKAEIYSIAEPEAIDDILAEMDKHSGLTDDLEDMFS